MDNNNTINFHYPWKKAIQTLYEMLIVHRGYSSLLQNATNPFVLYVFKKNKTVSTTPDILVYMCDRDKLNIDGLKEVIDTLQSHQVKKCLLVYKCMMTASAKKALDHMFDYDMELWNLAELQYNVTYHNLYVPHERVRDSELENVIPSSEIARLPKISKNDPIIRFFGWKRNQVIRVHRKDGSLAYRVVK
jgi:DNA-directed RNA polymerase subunit H (RpoH/RPB5)